MAEELSVTLPLAREPTHPGELIGEILEEHFHLSVPDAAARMGVTRQALHAFRLGFVHPMTGEAMEFRSTPPPDLVHGLQAWGLDYNRA